MARLTAYTFAAALVVSALAATPAVAHMNMLTPFPRGHEYFVDEGADYDIMAPAKGICQNKPPGKIAATYTAGRDIPVTLEGDAPHDGGHCQFSISYDGGKTFVVLKTIVNDCMINTLKYNVPLPADAPSSDKAVFAWSWISASGIRDYYMNCADVVIKGTPNGKVTGPKMLVAQILGSAYVEEWYPSKRDVEGRRLLATRPTITVGAGGQMLEGTPGFYNGKVGGVNKTTIDLGPTTPGSSPTEDISGGNTPTEDTPTEDTPTEDTPAEEKPQGGEQPSGGAYKPKDPESQAGANPPVSTKPPTNTESPKSDDQETTIDAPESAQPQPTVEPPKVDTPQDNTGVSDSEDSQDNEDEPDNARPRGRYGNRRNRPQWRNRRPNADCDENKPRGKPAY